MDKSELLKYIGNLSQTGGCRHYTLSDGWGRGMEIRENNALPMLHPDESSTNVLKIVLDGIEPKC